MRHTLAIVVLSLVPVAAEAAVTINEVAWMGDTVSANHEWIELYNSGEAAVSLDEWVLTDGASLVINLSGTMEAGAFAVLERTSEDSAPGPAFLIYTGALVNSGATLQLRDGGGAIVDQVAGGENWSGIGGDNVTKDTAQYTSGGWITAPATPGLPNATKASPTPPAEANLSGGSGVVAQPEARPKTVLSRTAKNAPILDLTIPEYLYVGRSSNFSAAITGVGEQLAPSTKYQWNFGDTYAAVGKSVTHTYEYPGTYVVTVTATVADRTAHAETEVTVLPVTVSLARNDTRDILLQNDAVYAVDLSGYVLRGNQTITLPPGTIIAPRGTITIASRRLEAVPGQSLVLLFAGDEAIAQAVPTMGKTIALAPSVGPKAVPTSQLTQATVAAPTTAADIVEARSTGTNDVSLPDTSPTPVAETELPASPNRRILFGLALILIGALIALWTVPRKAVGPQNSEL